MSSKSPINGRTTEKPGKLPPPTNDTPTAKTPPVTKLSQQQQHDPEGRFHDHYRSLLHRPDPKLLELEARFDQILRICYFNLALWALAVVCIGYHYIDDVTTMITEL
ncbi:hypothetical protein BJ878DRAFT_477898 [Calycina marina]|uniref:Uncharacterized protein n=1 Tax=Calycina marina TaxID=1763456 RepID=A0A9P8CHL5_9HELO|nr:hypothetical protein BJ878DRAFT_477898 [Calycina marina]